MEKEFEIKLATQRLFKQIGQLPVINNACNTIIDNRWQILEPLGEGCFGKIFRGFDLNKKTQGVSKPIIVKFTQNHKMNEIEYRAIKEIVHHTKK